MRSVHCPRNWYLFVLLCWALVDQHGRDAISEWSHAKARLWPRSNGPMVQRSIGPAGVAERGARQAQHRGRGGARL
eukprot:3162117-Pyramimonas_sp.AAC.2